MNPEARVLAVIEPDAETHRAIERGVRFAAGLGLPLELLDIVYDQFVEHDEKAVKSLMQNRRESAESLAKFSSAAVENISIEVRWGRSLADEVIKRAEESNAALVVKNTHHHSVLERTLLSNTDWELIRRCPAPLVLAKDRNLARKPRFLAAIDPVNDCDQPEKLDVRILKTGEKLSACVDGSLHPLHVLNSRVLTQPQPLMAGAAMARGATAMPTASLPPEEIDRLKQERREFIDGFVAESGLDPANARVVVGDPGSALIESAVSDQADFVVMGAIARGIVDRILIGHTAERILDRLPCDMIVVR